MEATQNLTRPSLFCDLMSYWAVGAHVLLFKCYGFMDFLSACWISAVTRSPTLSEQGSGDSSSLCGPACKYSSSPPHVSLNICVDSSAGRPHSHLNFPNSGPNPSVQHCSITVFSRMGLAADMAAEKGSGAVGGWWNELSWRLVGGEKIRGRRHCFLLPWKRLQMKRQAQRQRVNPK